MTISVSEQQLELFEQSPWIVRHRVPDSLQLWWELDWSRTAKARHTRAAFRRIVSFWVRRFVDELSKADMVDLRDHLAGLGLKQNTINTHHTMVTRWMSWLFECKDAGTAHGIDFRPIALPKTNIGSEVSKVDETQFQRGVAWTKRVVQKLIAAAQRLNDDELADIIDTHYITKLRPRDIWEMTDRNVDLAHKIVHGIQHKSVRRSMPSGLPYTKVITPRLERILRRRMALRKPGEPLFRDPEITNIDTWRGQVYKRFVTIRDFARLPHVNLCDMRPSAATLELDNGVDALSVSQGLGHTTLRMLPVYARRTVAHQRRGQEILEDDETEIIL